MDPSASKKKEKKTENKLKKRKENKKGKKKELVLDSNGKLTAGTIEAIVNYLLEQVTLPDVREDGELDKQRKLEAEQKQMLQVFIISYRQFVSPTRFFLILEDKFMSSKDPGARMAVLKMLSVWLEKYLDRDFFFHDKGNRLFEQLLKFVTLMGREDVGFTDKANEIKLLILRVKFRRKMKLRSATSSTAVASAVTDEKPVGANANIEDGEEQKEEGSSSQQSPYTTEQLQPGVPPATLTPSKKFSLCEMSLVSLAEQLTLIECNMFRAIKEREFLNLNWKRPENKRNSRHIVKMVERFNKVSYWVATRIVREIDQKRRTSLLKRFIILAEKCVELHNYNTVMEVLAGLNLHPVQRLKETWKGLSDKYRESMENLERLMENKQNYKNYRDQLLKVQETGEPTLPYLGVYLRDLTFIEEGNLTITEEGLINYEKIELIGLVIREVQFFQCHSQYAELKASEDWTTIKYLKKLRGLRQEQLDEKSKLCEGTKANKD